MIWIALVVKTYDKVIVLNYVVTVDGFYEGKDKPINASLNS